MKNILAGYPQCELGSNHHVLQRNMRNFLFFVEFVINDKVCLLYEGNSLPGRSSKNSCLDREFACFDSRQINGELHFDYRHPQGLSYKESRELRCCMEHDRMLFNGVDHQHSSLGVGEQIDEFAVLRHSKSDWFVRPDAHGSTVIGGLRSPCTNTRYYVDCVDRVGRVLGLLTVCLNMNRKNNFFT